MKSVTNMANVFLYTHIRAIGPLEAETQDEDEVYELQFGRHFGKGRVTARIPLEEE